MDVSPASIGESQFLVETTVTPVVEPATTDRYGTIQTGIKVDPRDAYTQLKALVRDIADDFGKDLVSDRPGSPSEMTLEFGLTFSNAANVWVMTASGQVSCKIAMKWSKG